MPNGRKSAMKELVQVRTGRALPDLLRELYVDRRHSQQEIADGLTDVLREHDIAVARSTVNDWLREYGITRDDRPAVAL